MVTRRAFLKAGGLGLVAFGAGGSPSFLGRAALAAAGPAPFGRRRVLVAIFQRGAMDGLAALAPLADPRLQRLRPRLALAPAGAAGEGAIDLDGRFGLHPALAPLLPLWRDGVLAAVHGVGSPDPTRSHFDAQDYMESGTPGRKGTASGWLNRATGLLGHEATPFQSVALTPALPRSLAGDRPALAVADLADFRPPARRSGAAADAGRGFEALAGRETLAAMELLSSKGVAGARPAPGADYPASPLGRNLAQIAALIKAEVGLEVAFAESGGWDTHVGQGAADGAFARRARDLAQAVAAFWTDLGGWRDDVALMTMTEFGRTVAENGSGGTDHGHASCLFVLGARIAGGRVHGELPPLVPEALHEGRDLPVTTDFRAVFAEVAGRHLGIADDRTLFPGWSGGRIALFARA